MVSKWILKAVVQKTISFLPYRHRINYLFQKHITKGVYLTDEYFIDRLVHASNHLRYFQQFSADKELYTSLELGTGWYPVVPVSFFLYGATAVHTVDITPLCNKKNVITTLEKFLEFYQSGQLGNYLEVRESRLAIIEDLVKNQDLYSMEDLARRLHFRYLVQDARHLSIDSKTIDLVTSNNTFEHIYPDVLEALLLEFKRVTRPGGILSHFVDMSDHFAHFDPSINIYNYLKFSDQQWQLIDNDIQPQNRWRINDYKALYHQLGLEITKVDCREGNMEDLKNINLDSKYQQYPLNDLAVSHCHIVSKIGSEEEE